GTPCVLPPAATSIQHCVRFRGKRLNIELGTQVVNSGQNYSSCMRKTRQNRPSTSRLPSLLFNKTFFSTILLRKLFIRLFSRPEKAPEKIRYHPSPTTALTHFRSIFPHPSNSRHPRPSPVSCPLSPVSCLLSPVSCPLSPV